MEKLVDQALEQILWKYKKEDDTLAAIEQIKLLFVNEPSELACNRELGVVFNETIPEA